MKAEFPLRTSCCPTKGPSSRALKHRPGRLVVQQRAPSTHVAGGPTGTTLRGKLWVNELKKLDTRGGAIDTAPVRSAAPAPPTDTRDNPRGALAPRAASAPWRGRPRPRAATAGRQCRAAAHGRGARAWQRRPPVPTGVPQRARTHRPGGPRARGRAARRVPRRAAASATVGGAGRGPPPLADRVSATPPRRCRAAYRMGVLFTRGAALRSPLPPFDGHDGL